MRLFVAALLGAIVMFLWGFVSRMVLPVGEMGMRQATREDAVLAAVRADLPGEGVYLLPDIRGADMKDAGKVEAYSAKARANPFVFVVYNPRGEDRLQMGGNLAREFATNFVSAAIVAFVMTLGAFGFARRLQIAGLMGLFGWLVISVPYWNWYRFPLDFTLGSLLEQGVGWLLAGAAMAWWLGRRPT